MNLSPLQTLAFAALVVYFGQFLKERIHFIDRYNLPSPVIGGFIISIFLAFLKSQQILILEFDKPFEETLMIAFFASIGYSASWSLLRKGGRLVAIFLLITVFGLLLQIAAGIGLAYWMDLPPLMGVLTGAVALTGGPGTALAFAPSFEAAGVSNASIIGLTTAMGGILIGGLMGTPIATSLIDKKKLKAPNRNIANEKNFEEDLRARQGKDLLYHFLAVALIMGIGNLIGNWFKGMDIKLPVYIGAMIAAAFIRNIEDFKPLFKIQPSWIEEIGSAALVLFIATAIMTLKLDQLKNAALPILIFLVVQALIVAITALGPTFWATGKDYEASVVSAGYVGFMMGTSANAMANMSSLSQKYGPAPQAFLCVPIVGSCFIDFINAAIITFCLNYL